MNSIIDYFKSNEFLQIAVKVLGFAALFLLLVVVIFIIVNKIKNRRRYETTIPYHGEIRGGKVYCALTDPLFSTVRDKNPDSTIADHIKNDLDTDIESLIGVRYHAISRTGRFLIIIRGTEYWVEPNEVDNIYSIHVRRTETTTK